MTASFDPQQAGTDSQRTHERLGAILVTSGVCTPQHVNAAMHRQRELARRSHYKHIGTILLEMGVITVSQLDRALDWQKLADSKG